MSITPVTTYFIPVPHLGLQKTGCNSHVKNTTIPEKNCKYNSHVKNITIPEKKLEIQTKL